MVLLAAGPAAVVAASAAGPAASVVTAWWWGGDEQGQSVPSPDVPAGGLYVGSTASGPVAVSALRVRVARSTPDARLVLRVHREQAAGSMTLALLPSTTSWAAGGSQQWSGRPGLDQQLPPLLGVPSSDGGRVTFDLGPMTAAEQRSVVLVPARAYSVQPGFAPDAPAQTFTISFEPVRPADLVLATSRPPRLVIPNQAPTTVSTQPGPALLHEPAPAAPQLENRPGSVWHAAPLLVSGGQAYRKGEYLYQGFLYDDHGGAGALDPNDPYVQAFLFAAKSGTLTYPMDKVYADNAANLLEVRIRPLRTSTAFRVTFTSLVDPRRTAFTLALGTSPGARSWPALAGVTSPAQVFVTVHGSTAQVVDAQGREVSGGATATVDAGRHQYDVRVPHSVWNPGRATQRVAIGSGLWDVAAGHYLQPGTVATATQPGGASPSHEALFDLGFRFHETMPDWSHMGLAYTIADAAVVEQADQKCFWRECAQAAALRSGDVSGFHADVDFGKLTRGATDHSGVPSYGYLDRVHASRFSFGQGVDPSGACGRFPVSCHGMFVGNLQPYQVYVPRQQAPHKGWALTVMLHASGANENERMGSRMEPQLAGRDGGSLVMTSLSRDPDGDYTDANEAEVFETWADVARHYPLDLSKTVIMGYSMGGGGTYKMAQRWPDLWAAGFGAAAVPFDDGWQGQWFPGMRNVPILTWIGNEDEGSGNNVQLIEAHDMHLYGFRFQLDQFPTSDHLTIATNDQYAPAVRWLSGRRVVQDPPRIDFVLDTRSDFPGTQVVADHAYWLSGLAVRDRRTDPSAAVGAQSLGFGLADPTVVDRSTQPGVLTGGQHGPMPYVETRQGWAAQRRVASQDHLELWARNLRSAVVDLRRARLDCHASVTVRSDGPLRLAFPGCGSSAMVGSGTTELQLADVPTSGRASRGHAAAQPGRPVTMPERVRPAAQVVAAARTRPAGSASPWRSPLVALLALVLIAVAGRWTRRALL